MRVIDVQPCAVGQDDIGQPEILVSQLARVCGIPGQVEAARIAERILLLEVPPRSPGLGRGCRVVSVDDLRGGDHRVRTRLPGYGDAVLGLDAHHPADAHRSHSSAGRQAGLRARGHSPAGVAPSAVRQEGTAHRYWPVLATVSMDRPASFPLLPETSVLM